MKASGGRAERHIGDNAGELSPSVFTVWLLHVLTKLEDVDGMLGELLELLLLKEIFAIAKRLDKPRGYEDRMHLSTIPAWDRCHNF